MWNTNSGLCFVTFTEHTSSVTNVTFTSSGFVIVSASLDGTVRAFDLHRYRNFRTFTSPRPAQFSSLAVDVSGELVSAGAQDSFEIFLWSMQTGRLLEVGMTYLKCMYSSNDLSRGVPVKYAKNVINTLPD